MYVCVREIVVLLTLLLVFFLFEFFCSNTVDSFKNEGSYFVLTFDSALLIQTVKFA